MLQNGVILCQKWRQYQQIALPESIGNLTSLQILGLDHNQLIRTRKVQFL